jgi:hypothetical protein
VVGVIGQRANPEDEGIGRVARMDMEITKPGVSLGVGGDPGARRRGRRLARIEGRVETRVLDSSESRDDDEDHEKGRQGKQDE